MRKTKIKKVEAKLHEVKTNKEYQAILKETETAKAENDKIEEDIISPDGKDRGTEKGLSIRE